MKIKKTIILLSVLMLFLLIAGVSANDINTTDEISTTNDVDENIESSTINPEVIEEDLNDNSDNKKLEYSYEDNLSDEGEFIDVNDAYVYLNQFRNETGVWQWNDDDTTKTVFNTNESNQLKPLARDLNLEETAKIRAKELVEKWGHERPDGTMCFTAFPDGFNAKGENIAKGQTSAYEVTEDWKEINDPYSGQGHRRNMLSSKFNCVGIAGYKLNGVIYWVQDFGYSNNINQGEIINPNTNNNSNTQNEEENNTKDKGTFTELNDLIQEASEGSIIKLEKNYTYDENEGSDFEEGIIITKSLTIDGQTYTIDANNLVRIFFVKSTNVIFKNMKFINGNANRGDGAAIYWDGVNGTVINSTFINNAACNGGAIFWDGVNGTVINSTFSNNNESFFVNCNGGAIYWNGANGIVINSTFMNNTPSNCGGAICWDGVNGTVINSTFINNTANGGGAIRWDGVNGTVINSTFSNNHENEWGYCEGGAIEWNGANGIVINSTFTNNNATNGRSINTDQLKIINSTFIQSNAQILYNEISYTTTYLNKIIINDCIFKNDTSEIPLNTIIYKNDLNEIIINDYPVEYDADKAFNISESNSSTPEYSINISKDATGDFVVMVDGNIIGRAPVIDGQATIKVPELSNGQHNIEVKYTGDSNYAAISKNITHTVTRISTSISAPNRSLNLVIGGTYSVTLKDSNGNVLIGKPVTLTINGKSFTVTSDASGIATIALTNRLLLSEGVKTITVKFAGDSTYNPASAIANITVYKNNNVSTNNSLTSEDFNVKIFDIDLDDENAYDKTAVSFYCPEGSSGGIIYILLNNDYEELISREIIDEEIGSTMNLTLDNLDIYYRGVYNLTVSYESSLDESMILASGNLKITKNLSADEFELHLFSNIKSYWRLADFDSYIPVDGDMQVWVNGTLKYTKYVKKYSELVIYPSELGINESGNYEILIKFNSDDYGSLELGQGNVVVSFSPPSSYEFDIEVSNNINHYEKMIHFSHAPVEGNLTVYVNGNLRYSEIKTNESYDCNSVSASDLNIKEEGIYEISVYFTSEYGVTELAKENITIIYENLTSEYFAYSLDGDDLENNELISFSYVPVKGNLTIYVDENLKYSKEIKDKNPGLIIYSRDLGICDGIHQISIKFSSEYGEVELENKNVSVPCRYIGLTDEIDFSDDDRYVCHIDDEEGIIGTVIVKINGTTYYNKQFNKNNNLNFLWINTDILNLNWEDFNKGDYLVKITYIKNGVEHNVEGMVEFSINPHIYSPVFMHPGEKEAFIITMPDSVSGNVTIYLHDTTGKKVYDSVNFVNGFARVSLDKLTKGDYVFDIMCNTSAGNYSYEEYELKVIDNSPGYVSTISSQDIIVGDSVIVTLSGNKSYDYASVFVDGRYYDDMRFNVGKMIIGVENLTKGEHYITIGYESDGLDENIYFSETYLVTVKEKSKDQTSNTQSNIKSNVIKLTLKKVKVKKSSKKIVLTATLKINNKLMKNKKLIFKFNGKKYTAKTNKKGVAKVTINKKVLKKLKVGKKIKYQVSYGKTVKKLTAKVKK